MFCCLLSVVRRVRRHHPHCPRVEAASDREHLGSCRTGPGPTQACGMGSSVFLWFIVCAALGSLGELLCLSVLVWGLCGSLSGVSVWISVGISLWGAHH